MRPIALALVLAGCAPDYTTPLGWPVYLDDGAEKVRPRELDEVSVVAASVFEVSESRLARALADEAPSVHVWARGIRTVRNGQRGTLSGQSSKSEIEFAAEPCIGHAAWGHELLHWLAWRFEGRNTEDHPADLFGDTGSPEWAIGAWAELEYCDAD